MKKGRQDRIAETLTKVPPTFISFFLISALNVSMLGIVFFHQQLANNWTLTGYFIPDLAPE